MRSSSLTSVKARPSIRTLRILGGCVAWTAGLLASAPARAATAPEPARIVAVAYQQGVDLGTLRIGESPAARSAESLRAPTGNSNGSATPLGADEALVSEEQGSLGLLLLAGIGILALMHFRIGRRG
ncbi:hypothetical protein C7444_12228 [Sphaerotilus hippei]|uniref:MYXO-CTERM domain-containing protein n=1 Tax=Sphaerotilus hippei TaxID=744406 RepID=A0A318GXI1_9BURK|nr:hypothetical protein [Sphaerotilus hippei]PXW92853.1 hypothetical protein C7444_12228 [Sphaerotilus hippei]